MKHLHLLLLYQVLLPKENGVFVLLDVFVLILLKEFIMMNELEILANKVSWYKDAVIFTIYLENPSKWCTMNKTDSSEFFLVFYSVEHPSEHRKWACKVSWK